MVFVVLDCVHSFWRFLYKSLENVGQCHQNQLTFLLKWRWGRPKVFALSCASLVSLVVNEKAVVRSSRLMFVNYYLILSDCSDGFCLRWFSKAMFSTLALYILRLRCLVISNTYKNRFWFFWKRGIRRFVLCAIVLTIFVQTVRKILGDFTERKTQTFQNDVEYVPKLSFWALMGFFLWL